MKTLSKEVQVAIINEAGSTYRNFILAALREGDWEHSQAIMEAAGLIAQHFINISVKNMN